MNEPAAILAGLAREAIRRKEQPSEADLAHLERVADLLDSRFSMLGVRFGLESMVKLVPVVGDTVGLGLSGYLIGQGWRMGARKRTIARMMANAAGDFAVGSVPVLGSLVDVGWKMNRKNVDLLRKDLARHRREPDRSD